MLLVGGDLHLKGSGHWVVVGMEEIVLPLLFIEDKS